MKTHVLSFPSLCAVMVAACTPMAMTLADTAPYMEYKGLAKNETCAVCVIHNPTDTPIYYLAPGSSYGDPCFRFVTSDGKKHPFQTIAMYTRNVPRVATVGAGESTTLTLYFSDDIPTEQRRDISGVIYENACSPETLSKIKLPADAELIPYIPFSGSLDGDSSSMPPDMLHCIPGVSGPGAPSAAEIDSMMETRQRQKN